MLQCKLEKDMKAIQEHTLIGRDEHVESNNQKVQ